MSEAENYFPDSQQESYEDIRDIGQYSRAVINNTDWTIETIFSQIEKGNVDLNPSFQRRSAWDKKRQSRLIESLIVSLPVPNIVLAEKMDERGRFIVIDGKQRLIAIHEFLSNKFELQDLDFRQDLEKNLFSDLPTSDRNALENAPLRSTLIRSWPNENFLYNVFYRLNSGSLALSPQELRRALVGTKILDRIDKYTEESGPFKKIFGGTPDPRMRDSELTLRFMAFQRSITEYDGDLKNFLDKTTRFFEKNWSDQSIEAENILASLDRALTLSARIFGEKNVFRKWSSVKFEGLFNRAVFDCVIRYLASPMVNLDKDTEKDEAIVSAFKDLCLNDTFRKSIETTTKSQDATFKRLDMWGQAFSQVVGRRFDRDTFQVI